ncbi:unnamed protein product [Mycena citricolor]|uniref:Uncharacterized protein n=1 Tax=Mycena citricolor TaxID=2018698 RepID=A0AAD2JWR0_9AGAR|nr:unnamed protein product [Mycena citricolor]
MIVKLAAFLSLFSMGLLAAAAPTEPQLARRAQDSVPNAPFWGRKSEPIRAARWVDSRA